MNLNIIIPCYNEEAIIESNIIFLSKKINSLKYISAYSITLIDDGSVDNTWKIISKLSVQNNKIRGIKLLKNFGHLRSLNIGFIKNTSNFLLMMDLDFRSEWGVSIILKMIKEIKINNYDIVQIKRSEYETIKTKKFFSDLFYFLFNLTFKKKIIIGAPDFRIMNSKVLKKFETIKHVIFFRKEILCHNFNIKILEAKQKITRKSKFTFYKNLKYVCEIILCTFMSQTHKNVNKIIVKII
jgi:glycosyltransferase involved in cell wall biosynthesis